VVNGLLWLVRTGVPWRDLPGRYGPWQTVYYHFAKWRDAGTWDELVSLLQAELNDNGMMDTALWCVDGSNIRAAKAAAGGRKKGATTPSRTTTRSAVREGAGGRNYT
jgi:transposase